MSDFNQENNRAVWFDIPVADLDRSISFYSAVLNCNVAMESFDDFKFGVLEHDKGNGGCLVVNPGDITEKGLMVYFNVDGRITAATKEVTANGGTVVQDVHPIGPHGFRSIVLDSEGNRIVLHSQKNPE